MSELAANQADFSPEHSAQEMEYYCAAIANAIPLEDLCGPTHRVAILYEHSAEGVLALQPLGRGTDTFRFALGLTAPDQRITMHRVFKEVYGPDPDNPQHRKLMLIPEQALTAEDMRACPWPLDEVEMLARTLRAGYAAELERRTLAEVVPIAPRQRSIPQLGYEAIQHAV